MNQKKSLENFKKEVREIFQKEHPNFTKEEIDSCMTDSEELWLQRMQDFSPKTVAQNLLSGLI